MSYLAMAEMADDPALRARVTACAAEQGQPQPEAWVQQHRWHVCRLSRLG